MVWNKAPETSGQGGEHDRRRGAFGTRKHRGCPLISELSLLVLSFLYGFVGYERNVGALDFSLLGILLLPPLHDYLEHFSFWAFCFPGGVRIY